MASTAKFHVGATFPDAEGDVLVYERSGDQYQPAFDVANADDTLSIDADGFVEVAGEPGETLWLFQQTGEDDNGQAVGQQIAVTIPDPDAESPITPGGDDPNEKVADDMARAQESYEFHKEHVIDPVEQEALKQEGIAAAEEEAQPKAKAEAKADDKPKAKAKS